MHVGSVQVLPPINLRYRGDGARGPRGWRWQLKSCAVRNDARNAFVSFLSPGPNARLGNLPMVSAQLQWGHATRSLWLENVRGLCAHLSFGWLRLCR